MPASPLPKLVCLPGLDGSGIFFDKLISALTGKTETKVLSYPTQGPQSYEALADHLKSQLPAEDYVLLGESFGGPLAILLADQAIRKPAGLILTATYARNPFPILGGLIAGAAPSFLTQNALPIIEATLLRPGDHEMAWKVFHAVSKLEPKILTDRLKAVTRCNVQKNLARLRCPIVYLQGTQDKLISKAHGAIMAKTAPNLRVVNVTAPHFVLQYDTGTLVQEHILPFVETTRSTV